MEIMPTLPDGGIDFILCDLPYGYTKCDWDKTLKLDELWNQYKRIIKSGGIVALFGDFPFSVDLINSNKQWYKYSWVWIKNNATNSLNAKKQPLRKTEYIHIFSGNSTAVYNPQGLVKRDKPRVDKNEYNNNVYGKIGGNRCSEYTNYPSNILHFNNVGSKQEPRFHPTQKPVALLEYLIKTYTNPGEMVLDNCAGVGSTCVAAKKCGRRYIGIEKEEKYFEIMCRRLNEI